MVQPSVIYLRCGSTSFRDRQFSVRYLSDFHTFHLHQYYGTMLLGDKQIALSPGTVTLSPARISSRYDLDQSGTHVYLHFETTGDIAFLGGAIADSDAFYSRQLRRIAAYARASSSGDLWRAAIDAAVKELVCRYLAEQESGALAAAEDGVARVATLLEERFSEPVQVTDLARLVGLSQNYLAKLFKQRYGKTVKGRLLEIRLSRARYLLLNTDLSVSEVGRRTGVPDPQYFSKLFRHAIGCSPGNYRTRAL